MVCHTTHHHVELGAPAISAMFAGQTMLELKLVMMAESSTRCVSGAERSAELDDCRELGGAMTKGRRISLEEENRVGRRPEPGDHI
jgi:hypothetical protein